ncbi:hypothetical protein [Longispora urticae]
MRLLPDPADRVAWAQLVALARAVLDDHHRGEETSSCVRCGVRWPCHAADLADLALSTAPGR